jgi:hypothetical protein
VTRKNEFAWHTRVFDAKQKLTAHEKQQRNYNPSPEQCRLN